MESIKTVSLGFIYGLWDSIKGMSLVFYIDKEIHKKNAEKEAKRQQNNSRRNPSPVPSSATAMFEKELQREGLTLRKQKPDECTLESLKTKQKPSKPSLPLKDRKIAMQVLKCCGLNGGFTWMSIIFFEHLLLPAIKAILNYSFGGNSQEIHIIWIWMHYIISFVFELMWVLPIFIVCKLVSSLWFNDIANEAYKVRKGKPNLIPKFSKLLADFLFNILVQILFLIQIKMINLLPYVGTLLSHIHLCLLYSLYSFEYKWFNMGWELHRRLNYIEINWPYFMGFGLPLTVLTSLSNSIIVSSCIFSIFFPLFILGANEATTITGTTNTPLRLFAPTIFASNLLFGGKEYNTPTANKLAQQRQNSLQQQQQQQQHHCINKDREPHRHSSNEVCSTATIPAQFRYPQPPQKISPTSMTSERSSRSEIIPSQIRYNESTRTLIPTPVPGAPRPPSYTPSKATINRS